MKAAITIILFWSVLISTCGQQKKPPNDLDKLPTMEFKIKTFDLYLETDKDHLTWNMNDSSVTIVGDTMKVIRMLLVNYQELNNKYYECKGRFDTAKTIYMHNKTKSYLNW